MQLNPDADHMEFIKMIEELLKSKSDDELLDELGKTWQN